MTDTLHKERFHEGVDGSAVASAFLNTYTLALSETLGRSYGGGVLTFEPGEMRKMRIPMKGADKLDIKKIDRLQREGIRIHSPGCYVPRRRPDQDLRWWRTGSAGHRFPGYIGPDMPAGI